MLEKKWRRDAQLYDPFKGTPLMNRLLLLLLLCPSLLIGGYKRSPVVETPTFELLNGMFNERDQRWKKLKEKDAANLALYAPNYYNKIGLLQLDLESEIKIPKVIHFIWVGPRPYPEESVENVASWKAFHPEWKMVFWTDNHDRPCPIEGMEKRLIDEIPFIKLKPYLSQTKNYAEMADMIRYEVLYNEGGVYVDHDVECLTSFDSMNRAFDFYVCLENPHTNSGSDTRIFPCNCLIGVKPNHPILLATIDIVDLVWDVIGKRYPESDPKNTFARVMNRTFRPFTMATEMLLSSEGNNDMVLPSCYFFAHKSFNKTTKSALFDKGFVFASHAFASTWRDKKPKVQSKSEKSKERRNRKK